MTVRPKTVMRFYGNLEYAIQSIAFKEITFLHSDKLNDPFDPYFYFITDFNENYSTLIDFVQQRHAKDLQYFEDRLPQSNWDKFIKLIEGHFKLFLKGSYLFSTCAISKDCHPKDNLYMWSHYGNGHRGVAIEFDTTLLSKAVLDKQKRLGNKVINIDEVWTKVNYTTEVPKITCEAIFQFIMNDLEIPDKNAWEGTELSRILSQIVRSKSIEWKIENEWRLMWQNDETKVKVQRVNLYDESVAAIYLGCLIDNNAKDNLISEAKQNFPIAKIFGGKKVKGEFALEFEQLA
ncbi:MAG: DUF2971 domain-containing protein [Steroidobacteraceae bacterium]|nr:DUF2971 domain-containing protein [Deltaproteobacteria bacterium]